MFFNDINLDALLSGYLIYFGCFAATLSSAIASLVGAPRVLQVSKSSLHSPNNIIAVEEENLNTNLNPQALAADKLYPKIEFFAKGYGPGSTAQYDIWKIY